MSAPPVIVWFRQDLRLRDNPALAAACGLGRPVLPVFVHDEEGEGRWRPGAASRWWLHQSLAALTEAIAEKGGRLLFMRGAAARELGRLQEASGADAVYWNRRYEPAAREQEVAVETQLREHGVRSESANAALLFEPNTIRNRQGQPFKVFTPFWRTCLQRAAAAPGPAAPRRWPAPERWPDSLRLDDLDLAPQHPWTRTLAEAWQPGEAAALAALRRFMRGPIDEYDEARDHPAERGTSRLSPHLHFGEIGPRQIWAAAEELGRENGVFPSSNGARVFLAEVGWREFAYHQLYHFPLTPEQPLRTEFARFPWREDPDGRLRRAWQEGRTGYPLVDAGLRELWQTGWMHNRVRMVVASFLVKHLRLPWNLGAAWFWDTLVDADLANNTLGWQWTAGCGADAAPYFRIFNPTSQGTRYDADGAYVRRWVPELAKLPGRWLHAPVAAPPEELDRAGVVLGQTYPYPIVEHAEARAEALAALQRLRRTRP